ncbi:MAG: GxxExxY protein, partial [Bacteroidota bacterium]
ADFVVFDKIIFEVKAIELLTDSHTKQTLNYLAASKQKLGLLVNFGQDSLEYKRIIL